MSERIGNEKTNNIGLNMIVPADWKHVWVVQITQMLYHPCNNLGF